MKPKFQEKRDLHFLTSKSKKLKAKKKKKIESMHLAGARIANLILLKQNIFVSAQFFLIIFTLIQRKENKNFLTRCTFFETLQCCCFNEVEYLMLHNSF